MNYTKEITEYIVNEYQKEPGLETVARLAEELNKPRKSIIGKLSREGVYRRNSYKTKTGEDPITKAQLVMEIADLLGVEESKLLGLDKAPKGVLGEIKTQLEESVKNVGGIGRN